MTTIRSTRRHLEDQLIDCTQRICAAGWCSGSEAKFSARVSEDRFLFTPANIPKSALCREVLQVVDRSGTSLCGEGEGFIGQALHLEIYSRRPEIRAILQVQPPTAMGLSVAGVPLVTTFLPDAVVALGREIPSVSYAAWSAMRVHLVASVIQNHDVVMLEHCSLLTVGADLSAALARAELVEHLSRVQLAAIQAGRVRALPNVET